MVTLPLTTGVGDSFAGRRALVTGASGFIGSTLAATLSRLGAEVHGVSRSEARGSLDLTQWHLGDLSDMDFVEALFGSVQPELVFHLAGHVSGSRDLSLVLPTVRSNLLASINLLVASAEMGCSRVVLAGSLEEPSGERPDLVPCSPYAASKWATGAYARMFGELYGLSVVTARLFMVYGPGQTDLQKLVPYSITRLLKNESLELSSGTRPVDWVYIDDVVEGMIRIAEVKGMEGATIEIGTGVLTSIRDVIALIAAKIGGEASFIFGERPDRALERVVAAEVEATEATLGWRPKVTLRSGLATTIEWYERNR